MTDHTNRIWEYAVEHTTDEDQVLQQLYRETHLKTIYPRMISGHLQGKLLEMISCMIRPKRILEIGTFTGYSAICLAKGLVEGGLLHTIDINDELEEIAMKYFQLTGNSDRIILHTGNAVDILPGLDELFDLVFIDGNKSEYINYYELVIKKIGINGFILADNVIWGGKVLPESGSKDKETKGIRAFNDFVAADKRVEKVLLPVKDGIYILRKIND